MVFHLAIFFDLTNVFVQLILFPLNLVLRASLTFFLAWKVKEALGRCWFCWFSLCKTHLTYYFSDDCWFVQSFSRIFPIERLHPTDKIWLISIICLATIISYYHLVSLNLKNWDHYLLAASEWLCKYICKLSIRSLGPLSLFQVIAETLLGCTCYHVRARHLRAC